jgi:hypothetical protein
VLLRNAAVVAAAILHPPVKIMMSRSGASGAKQGVILLSGSREQTGGCKEMSDRAARLKMKSIDPDEVGMSI